MKKGYCEKCNCIVDYHAEENLASEKIKGKEYTYLQIIGYCNTCGEVISANEILDENLSRLDEAYRNAEHIISIDEINMILKRYHIGRKPLAKLLGWGEVTLIRYLNGAVPSKIYSEQLYILLNNEEYMIKLLDENKDRITERTYNNVKKAIKGFKGLAFEETIYSDIEIVADYILSKENEITPLALQKELFQAQGFFKAFFGVFLFSDDCQAWVHGPVYPKIYNKYREYKFSNITQRIDYDIADIISDEKKELLDAIINSFGLYSGKSLELITHNELPWINARNGANENESMKAIISKSDIASYFEGIKEKYKMQCPSDIKLYSMDMFRKHVEPAINNCLI